VIAPVNIGQTSDGGISLSTDCELLDPGGRRAGLLAHSFARYTYGQRQRKHTGWLEVAPYGDKIVYAPHTASGYYLPWSRFAYRLAAGFATRRGYREAVRAGFAPAETPNGSR
jgi:hypothetical protein